MICIPTLAFLAASEAFFGILLTNFGPRPASLASQSSINRPGPMAIPITIPPYPQRTVQTPPANLTSSGMFPLVAFRGLDIPEANRKIEELRSDPKQNFSQKIFFTTDKFSRRISLGNEKLDHHF
ncbi:MAG: hypothetical protein ACXVBE_04355, partial [Bdellovibrionota bacterium]